MDDLELDELIVQHSDLALATIATMHSTGSLDLSPRFQRRDRWDREKQSRLIESFLMNMPVPPVYLAEESRGVYTAVDGKQRLTAIAQFLANEYPLTGLSARPRLNGCRFSDLNPIHQNDLSIRPLRASIVLRQNPDSVKHEVFMRLNTGGQPLNAQEVRNVVFAGELNDLMIHLGEDAFLQQQLKITSPRSAAYADMTNVELALRFFAVASSWENFSGSVRNTLDDFMFQNHRSSASATNKLYTRFKRAIYWCENLWGNHAFQRFDGNIWRSQLIQAVYDAQMVAVDSLSDSKLANLNPSAVLHATMKLFSDPLFETSIRANTNTPSRVRYRIDAVGGMLAGM